MSNEVISELLDKIKELQKTNTDLTKEVNQKEKQLNDLKVSNNMKKKNSIKKKEEISEEEKEKIESSGLLNEYKNVKINAANIEKNVKEYVIQYIPSEQNNYMYIMGDFTNWEMEKMQKSKDIFSYKTILLNGFKYYYCMTVDDNNIIDVNAPYEENPKNYLVMNYIDLTKKDSKPLLFDYQKEENILKAGRRNKLLLKMGCNDEELLILDKTIKNLKENRMNKDGINKRNNIIRRYYLQYYEKIYNELNPFTQEQFNQIKNAFKGCVLFHNLHLSSFRKLYYSICCITNEGFKCLPIYDSNAIKASDKLYMEMDYFEIVPFMKIRENLDEKDRDNYGILDKKTGEKLKKEAQQGRIIKAYFLNLQPPSSQNKQKFLEKNGRTLIIPIKIEPGNIKINDYEFLYNNEQITSCKNTNDNIYVKYEAIETEPILKPQIMFYSLNDQIVHAHILNQELKDINTILDDIGKNEEKKKIEECIKKSNETIVGLTKLNMPIKMFYKNKEIGFDINVIKSDELYKIKTKSNMSEFSDMIIRTKSTYGNYCFMEQCVDYSIKNLFIDYVDVEVIFDKEKNLNPEPLNISIPPCLLKNIALQENIFLQNVIKNGIKEMPKPYELRKYDSICKNVESYKKILTDEGIKKLSENEKEDILFSLEDFKSSMEGIMGYIENNEMWDLLDNVSILSADIDELLNKFKN